MKCVQSGGVCEGSGAGGWVAELVGGCGVQAWGLAVWGGVWVGVGVYPQRPAIIKLPTPIM